MNSSLIFTHDAMKTTFSIQIESEDAAHAKNAANDAFRLLDEIEQSLSRYISGSDVWQINHMQAGDTLFLNEICYNCLQMALEAYVRTDGLFDVTLGRAIEHYKNDAEGATPAIEGQLMVDPERPAIHCIQPGREVDLGGIGKGFALDQMKTLLLDWEIESALLSAGASTRLALGSTEWTIQLLSKQSKVEVILNNNALSASGTEIQGSHILSPLANATHYVYPRLWLIAPSATEADACSTATMLMNPDQIEKFLDQNLSLYAESKDGKIRTLGSNLES